MAGRPLDRVREIALALPEVGERLSHGEPCFFIRDDVPLCYVHANHRGNGRVELWCPAPPGVQDEMVTAEPARFFRPPASTTGTFSDWLGVYLDTSGPDYVDWDEIAAVIGDAYRTVAPARLLEQLSTQPDHSDVELPTSQTGRYRFRSELRAHTGESAWYFVTLPTHISHEIRELTAAARRGFGSVRVVVTVGATTWSTSVFPDTGTRSYVLPVKKQVRVSERIGDGDMIDVSVELEGATLRKSDP
jgi:hypothetical protein